MDNTWKEGAFSKIMKTYKNKVLSRENAVATKDVFCCFLWHTLKKPNDMTPKALKAHFNVLINFMRILKMILNL